MSYKDWQCLNIQQSVAIAHAKRLRWWWGVAFLVSWRGASVAMCSKVRMQVKPFREAS